MPFADRAGQLQTHLCIRVCCEFHERLMQSPRYVAFPFQALCHLEGLLTHAWRLVCEQFQTRDRCQLTCGQECPGSLCSCLRQLVIQQRFDLSILIAPEQLHLRFVTLPAVRRR